MGLSMGGRIVLEATLAAPVRVRALVLLDAVLDGVPWDPDSERGIQAIGEGLRSGGLQEAKAAWLRHDVFVPAQRTPDVARRLAEMVGDYSGVNWTSADPHAPHPNSIELLATIAAPTTVVIAELDVPCFHDMSDILAPGFLTRAKSRFRASGTWSTWRRRRGLTHCCARWCSTAPSPDARRTRSGCPPNGRDCVRPNAGVSAAQTHALTAGSTVVAASSTCRGSSPSGQRYTRSQPASA